MKHSFYILLLIIVAVSSCEGRKAASKTLSQSVEEFKKNNKFKTISYHPENYAEMDIDTTLSNGFNIKMNLFTDMNSAIVKTSKNNSIQNKVNYRRLKSEVSIEYENNLVFKETIDYSFIKKHIQNETEYLNLANLDSVWIDQYQSLKKSYVILNVDFRIPETQNYKTFVLKVNKNGTFQLQKKDEDIF